MNPALANLRHRAQRIRVRMAVTAAAVFLASFAAISATFVDPDAQVRTTASAAPVAAPATSETSDTTAVAPITTQQS